MRYLPIVPLILLVGCGEIDPGQVTLELTPQTIYADGKGPMTAKLCLTGSATKPVSLKLKSSLGKWVFAPDSAPTERDLAFDANTPGNCRSELWVPPTQVSLVLFEVFAGTSLLAERTLNLNATQLAYTDSSQSSRKPLQLLANPAKLPASTSQTVITLSMDWQVEGGGSPSDGTQAELDLLSVDPPATAYLEDAPIVAGQGTGGVNLTVLPGVQTVCLRVRSGDACGTKLLTVLSTKTPSFQGCEMAPACSGS